MACPTDPEASGTFPRIRPTASPGTPQGKGEGRGEIATATALWKATTAVSTLVAWANENQPLIRFVGQWHGFVPMDPDANPMPPKFHLFRRTR